MEIQIKVIPNASRTELIKTEAGYKARIQCPPVDGKANDACQNYIKYFPISFVYTSKRPQYAAKEELC